MPTKDQKAHDLAVAFAVAEYENELKRRHDKSDVTIDAPQQKSLVFHFLYDNAIKDFKKRLDISDD